MTEIPEEVKKEVLKKIGLAGGNRTKELYGPAFYAKISKLGGEANKKKQPPDYFKRISKLSVEARRKKRDQKVEDFFK